MTSAGLKIEHACEQKDMTSASLTKEHALNKKTHKTSPQKPSKKALLQHQQQQQH